MKGIVEALAKATTEDEEHEALMAARDHLWPLWGADQETTRREANRLLDGPRAGWIGVPLLAMPADIMWNLGRYGSFARANVGKGHVARAPLDACALMLAVLAAREAKP